MENTEKVLFEDDKPEWYLATGDRWVGPLAASDVYERILNHEITWAHFVWRKGQSEWKRICDVKTFQAAVPHLPPKGLVSEIKEASKPGLRPAPPRAQPKRVWYLYYNDAQFGPFSEEEISRFIQIGKIHAGVYCWREGLENWELLGKVREFSAAFAGTRKSSKPPKAPSASGRERGEQRASPRRPLVARLLLASGDQVIVAMCRDISVGGMQVLTDQIPSKAGSRIRINVSPAGDDIGGNMEPFVAEGMIVRILEDRRGFSFRFDRLSDAARRSIENYIQQSGS